MSYDAWKTTEPDNRYDPDQDLHQPEPAAMTEPGLRAEIATCKAMDDMGGAERWQRILDTLLEQKKRTRRYVRSITRNWGGGRDNKT